MSFSSKNIKSGVKSKYWLVLSSDSLIKEWNQGLTCSMRFTDEEFSEQFEFLRVGFFLVSLLECYIRFLLVKIKKWWGGLSTEALFGRETFIINTIHKHILVVEWGFYNGECLRNPTLLNFLSPESILWKRPYNLFEYETTHFDLLFPTHKTALVRFTLPFAIKSMPPHIGNRWFFKFYCLIPAADCREGQENLFRIGSSFPIMSLLSPISFEFFLLRFTFMSFLLSTSYSHIYEFYSLGFIEAIFIRLRCITDRIIIATFQGILGYPDFSSYDKSNYILLTQMQGTIFFYSFKKVKRKNILRSLYLKNFLLYRIERYSLYGLSIRLIFFFFKLCSLLIFCFVMYFYGLQSAVQLEELSTAYISFRLNFSSYVVNFYWYIAYFLLGFVTFYYFLTIPFHYHLMGRFFSRITKYDAAIAHFILNIHTVFYGIKQLITKSIMAYVDSIFVRLIGLLFYSFLFTFWFTSLDNIVLFSILVSIGLYFIFSFFSVVINVTYKIFKLIFMNLFGQPRLRSSFISYMDTFSSIEIKTYFPLFFFVSIVILIIIAFVIHIVLSFCYFLRIYFPPTIEKARESSHYWILWQGYSYSAFMLPFLSWSEIGNFDYAPLEPRYEVSDQLSINQRYALYAAASPPMPHPFNYYVFLLNFNYLRFKFIRKFLLDRSQRLYHIDYCNYVLEEDGSIDYKGREIQRFPNRIIYSLIIIDLFIVWVSLNFFIVLKSFFLKLFCFLVTLFLSFFPNLFVFHTEGCYTLSVKNKQSYFSYIYLRWLEKFLVRFYCTFDQLVLNPFFKFSTSSVTPDSLDYCVYREKNPHHNIEIDSIYYDKLSSYFLNPIFNPSNFKFIYYFTQENVFYIEHLRTFIYLDLNWNIYNLANNRYIFCDGDITN